MADKVLNEKEASALHELRARFIQIAFTTSWKDNFKQSKSDHLSLFDDAEYLIKKSDDFHYINEVYNIQTEILNEIAQNTLVYQGDTQSAIDYYLKAIKLNEKDGILEDSSISISYAGLGDCYSEMKDRNKANEYYEKSLRGARNIGNNRLISTIAYKIALFIIKKAKVETDNLISEELAEDAEEMLEESLTIAEDRNNKKGIFRALSGLLQRSLISNELEMADVVLLKLDEYEEYLSEEVTMPIKNSIIKSLTKISDVSDIHREKCNYYLSLLDNDA